MDWLQLFLTVLLAACVTYWLWLIWLMWRAADELANAPDESADCQDDFRASMVRWGYLNEKRNDP
jgi:threonine/homoserine/homoserine lactone efflux protein